MKKGYAFMATLLACFTHTLSAQYSGGVADGYANAIFCGQDLSGIVSPALVLNAITGPSSFCANTLEKYSVELVASYAFNYEWSSSSGILSNLSPTSPIRSSANFTMNSIDGWVSVNVSNGCTSATQQLLLNTTSCAQFEGGLNDGFSFGSFCGGDLNGGLLVPLAVSAISGNSSLFYNLGENFSVSVTAGSAVEYRWSGPPGSVKGSQFDAATSSKVMFLIGPNPGNINVTVSNYCSSANVTLPVTGQNCAAFYGGVNDGFALPMELTKFSASYDFEIVKIEWQCESELNNDYFTVERSINALDFSEVIRVNAAGTSSAQTNYVAHDIHPIPGVSYYRLRQTDFNGEYSFSKVVSVESPKLETVYVYPNPLGNGNLTIEVLFSFAEGMAVLQLIDPLGRISGQRQIRSGERIDLGSGSSISPGVYLVKVIVEGKIFSTRLVVLETQ